MKKKNRCRNGGKRVLVEMQREKSDSAKMN